MDSLKPFESPKELINGAKEQLLQLDAACRAFGDNCPYEIVTHNDNKAGEKVVGLRLKNRLPPRIRRLASSILKEARLALDQSMCDGAIVLGRSDAKNVYFPFGKSVADLRQSRKDKCKRVDRRLIAYAMRFKPYYGGNRMLWSLARLATYSHQRIIEVRPQDRMDFPKAVIGGHGPLQLTINKWIDMRNELEVARLPIGASLAVKNDFVLTLNVIFSQSGEAVAGREVVAALTDLVGIAESIVLGIEAETARLKAG